MKRSSAVAVPCAFLGIVLPVAGVLAGIRHGQNARHLEEALQAVVMVVPFCLGGGPMLMTGAVWLSWFPRSSSSRRVTVSRAVKRFRTVSR